MSGRGRRPEQARWASEEACVLSWIWQAPWSEMRFIQTLSRLPAHRFARVVQTLRARGWVEIVAVPARSRAAPRRLAITAESAARMGWDHGRVDRDRLQLSTLRRDPARYVFAHGLPSLDCAWLRVPFVLAAKAVRPERPTAQPGPPPAWAERRPYRAVTIDLLAGLRVAADHFLTLALLVDCGGRYLSVLRDAFRSLAAWSRRPEHAGYSRWLPVTVVITQGWARLQTLRQTWVNEWGGAPGALRLVDLDEVRADQGQSPPVWRTERGASMSGFAGLTPAPTPTAPPSAHAGAWWAAPAQHATSEPAHLQSFARHTFASRPAPRPGRLARLVQHLHTLSALERHVLDRVGLYPALTGSGLADVLGLDGGDVRRALKALRDRNLVAYLDESDPVYHLTAGGLAFLGALIGLEPIAYARLRGWSVVSVGAQVVALDVSGLRHLRAHQDLLLGFLRGLRRFGPRHDLITSAWQHSAGVREELSGGQDEPVRLTPDAAFTVQVATRAGVLETRCWLEIDRATMHGQALRRKLRRYYRLSQAGPSVRGRAERLLIVVPEHDEARLQVFRRRLAELDHDYGVQLDALVTRWDQLWQEGLGPDPALAVWRSAARSEFSPAFKGLAP